MPAGKGHGVLFSERNEHAKCGTFKVPFLWDDFPFVSPPKTNRNRFEQILQGYLQANLTITIRNIIVSFESSFVFEARWDFD